jgi:hypothetical protein
VDRIGPKSRIVELARNIEGTIIQMSASYWPKQVAQVLHQVLGFQHPLLTMLDGDIESYLKDKLSELPLEQFLGQLHIATEVIAEEI